MFGIIKDVIDCPQCGMPAIRDNYHVTNEEAVACNYCGYNHVRDLKGKKAHKGYGCIHYVSKDDTETIVRLKEPLSLIGRNEVFSKIQSEYDPDKSEFFVWDNDELCCIVGKIPLTLDQQYELAKAEAQYHAMIMRGVEPEDII